MDVDVASSSSSICSSESEAGIFTNDEGREGKNNTFQLWIKIKLYCYCLGDDEQSDWVGNTYGTGDVTDDDIEQNELDSQRLLAVSLQRNVGIDGRGPLGHWCRKVYFLSNSD